MKRDELGGGVAGTRGGIPAGRRIAVVGGGIAGLAAAWLLSRRHAVTLYEAEPRLGGHAHTVDVTLDGVTHPVDTGFLVFNRRTYPHLCGLFATLGVEVADSDMSFAVRVEDENIEWAGSSLATVFAQRSNLFRPAFHGMLRDILRFNRQTTRLARDHAVPSVSLGGFLREQGYGTAFRDWYLLPMAAAIWSCPAREMLEYPLATFLRFCHNHGLLQILDRPRWLTVRNGSRQYVNAMAASWSADLRLASPVLGVQRDAEGVRVMTLHGAERFDEVVFACHSDQALRILGPAASDAECAVLSRVRYQPNRAVLHTDTRLLPRRQRVWSAWNYLAGDADSAARPVSVSYLINRLQPLPFSQQVIVSLNPVREPQADSVLAEIAYAHPVFDQAAIDAQAHLPALQGGQHTWYCGAWTGYGFHEDGLRSAVNVAAALGVVAPWVAHALTDAERPA